MVFVRCQDDWRTRGTRHLRPIPGDDYSRWDITEGLQRVSPSFVPGRLNQCGNPCRTAG